MKQYILKVPENETTANLSDNAKLALKEFSGSYSCGSLVGSEPVLGYKLKLVMCTLSRINFDALLSTGWNTTDEAGDPVLIDLLLDWEILADQETAINQSLILPYMSDVPVFDAEGVQTGTEPVTDLTGKIQTFAGKKWLYV